MKKKITKILIALIFILFFFPSGVFAQESFSENSTIDEMGIVENSYTGKITGVKNYDCNDEEPLCKEFEIKITNGNRNGEEIVVEINTLQIESMSTKNYEIGDNIMLLSHEFEENVTYFITDHYRSGSIYLIGFLFVITVLLVGRKKGFYSLVGLGISILVLFQLIIPLILKGSNPQAVALFGGILIIVPAIFLSHGFNKKSTIALLGSAISLFLVFVMSNLFTDLMEMTGLGAEETSYLIINPNYDLNFKNLLIASLIFSGIGILDDVTVSQSAIVKELTDDNPAIERKELYKRAMEFGKDHISSMVNTLFLAYASASFPLILVLTIQGISMEEIINNEAIAEEILRTLVGSIGLVLAVPITTAIAVYAFKKEKVKD